MITDHALYVFQQVWRVLPQLRCEVKVGEHIITTAKINRLLVEGRDSLYGQSLMPNSIVELLASEAVVPGMPDGCIVLGAAIGVRMVGASKWFPFRVGKIQPQGPSILRVILEAKN